MIKNVIFEYLCIEKVTFDLYNVPYVNLSHHDAVLLLLDDTAAVREICG